jgi:hypothetical protein
MSGNMLDGLAQPEFNETVDRYIPNGPDLREAVEAAAPAGWRFMRNGVWWGCSPPPEAEVQLSSQGWKIHISAAAAQAVDLLKVVVPILTARVISFKFALDSRMLNFMNSKQWSRAGSGKFITVYPHDDAEFFSLIEELHQATRHFDGPYVLSDRRYKDSRVIHYRYGGIVPRPVVTVRGEMQQMLLAPDGELVPDRRVPYFVMPPWMRDPFRDDSAAPGAPVSEVLLRDGRYKVTSILRYSNAGGIYVATDTTNGETVVIKEARPMVMTTEDATALLQKEFRLLSKVAHLRLASRPDRSLPGLGALVPRAGEDRRPRPDVVRRAQQRHAQAGRHA